MAFRFKNIFFVGLLFAASIGSAQGVTLSLEECRAMAIETNYNLKNSVQRALIAEDMLAAYKTNHLPNFSLSANYIYSTASLEATIEGGYLPIFTNGVMSSESFAYMPSQSYELEIGSAYNVGAMVTQPIYMGRRVSNAIKLARVGVEVSAYDRQRSEAEVLQLLDNAFYQLLEVEDMLLSAQKYQEVVAEFHRQMESGYNRGMKTRNDLLKTSVKLNEAEILTQKATNGVRLAKMNLCYMVGLPLSTLDIKLQSPEEVSTKVSDVDLDITARAEYAMLESQIEAKELEAKITRGEFLPTLSAVATYGYQNGIILNSTTLQGNSFTGGVMLSVPIFHWGEGRRKTAAKEREIVIAQNQMEDLRQQMTLELLRAIQNYNESILEVQLYEQSLTQTEENMRMSESQYNAGMETIADYLESQALWQKAMGDLCSAKGRQRSAYTTYLRCRGELTVR